jgi:exopolysaccharide production protein ExoY
MYFILKRTLDIIVALVMIVLLSPIMIVTSLVIKIASPEGPVFADIPGRVTKGGKTFKMYKFRSMIPNAHEWLQNNPEWYKKYQDNNYKLDEKVDPRIIFGGRFIRKYSIDEIPQFLNVLKGEMSVVGPRAYFPFELKEQAERYPETIPHIEAVKTILPGITGVWQVSGRSNIGFVKRVKMDAEYAKKRSVIYDILIMLKTPLAVISKKGAY